MSIATAIQNAQNKVASAYSKCNDKGATMPATQDLANLAMCIDSIPSGGGGGFGSRVSYLESTGTQYISTGYVPNATTQLILDAALTQIEAVTMAGLYKATTQRFNFGVYTNQWHFGVSSNNASSKWINFTTPAVDAQRHTFEVRGDGYCAVDSTTQQITVDNTGTYANAIYLFARNNVGSVGAYASMRLYEAIIKENDVVIHDFIPIRVGQVGFLYDTVTDTLHQNSGTGDFVLGTDV